MFKLAVVLAVVCMVLAVPKSKPIPMDGRIVGGHNTDISKHPWQVSVQHRNEHFCGGFLISNFWVVTSAHCIVHGYDTNLSIRAGTSTWSNNGESVPISYHIVHQIYDDKTRNNDIALLHLARPLTNDVARAAVLPVAGQEVATGASVTITGWGSLREDEDGPLLILQEVDVPAISRDECRELYSVRQITTHMFCAGDVKVGGKDACHGDDGGPAVVNGEVVGVISWGGGCGKTDSPGVYTQISSVRDWIKLKTGI
ncbi:hypothetical protein JTB14_031196 [Gonioctena quinquepunctata]|nr:hypothetical protein JTB14_031196 [Gonioctena quinquepunctata]